MSSEHEALIKRLKLLEEQIMISEIGNDFYHSSPLYKAHQAELFHIKTLLKRTPQDNLSTGDTFSPCKSSSNNI